MKTNSIIFIAIALLSSTAFSFPQDFREPSLPVKSSAPRTAQAVGTGVVQQPATQTDEFRFSSPSSQNYFLPPGYEAVSEPQGSTLQDAVQSNSSRRTVTQSNRPIVDFKSQFVPQGTRVKTKKPPLEAGNLRQIINGEATEDVDPSKPAGVEVVFQRFPDGKIQVRREMMQDEKGNYFNHGEWELRNRKQQTIATGRFQNGLMDGLWKRWHPQSPNSIFSEHPIKLFKGPYLSTATFTEGKLDGVWVLYDQYDRKIFEISYEKDVRHGPATWFFPNTMKTRQANFKNGLLDGELIEWDEKNQIVRRDEYVDGQRIVRQTTYYRPNQVETENYFLAPKLQLDGKDNWWEAKPASFVATGSQIQIGPTVSMHENGQTKMRGTYKDNVRVGKFTWWYPNGQKQIEGAYETGDKVGTWMWWHKNGTKANEGQYDHDVPVGTWTRWTESGELQDSKTFDPGSSIVDREPPQEGTQTQKEATESLPDQVPTMEEMENLPNPTEVKPNENEKTDPKTDSTSSDEKQEQSGGKDDSDPPITGAK